MLEQFNINLHYLFVHLLVYNKHLVFNMHGINIKIVILHFNALPRTLSAVSRLQTGQPRHHGLIWSKSYIFSTSFPNYTMATSTAHKAFYVLNTGGTFHGTKAVWGCGGS